MGLDTRLWRMRLATLFLLTLVYKGATSDNIPSLMEILDTKPLTLREQVICAKQWVEQCSRVRVDFSHVGKPKLKLPVGGIFKKIKPGMSFRNLKTNLTFHHYTSSSDQMFMQYQKEKMNSKLLLYSNIAGVQYNVVPCGYMCHLWIQFNFT